MKYIFLILLIFPFLALGQSVGKWRAGSANKLSGKVYHLSCFISEEGDSWTTEEKQEVLKEVKISNAWVVKQAALYNQTLEFQTGTFGLDKDIKMANIERGTGSGSESVDWVSKVLYKIGYSSTLEFYDWVLSKTECKNAHVIIFVKGKGRGYAMASSTEMDKEKYFVEGAMLYQNNTTGGKLTASSIAHEMFHLYAAWDLYQTFSQTKENEAKARKLFPNSIMLRTSYNIDELEVDEVTAWLIGWNNKPKPWYEDFREDE